MPLNEPDQTATASQWHVASTDGLGGAAPKRSNAKTRKWFVNEYAAKITLRKVSQWDEFHVKHGTAHYFDTWEQAHDHLNAKAARRLKKAKAELPAAQRNIARVDALKPPGVAVAQRYLLDLAANRDALVAAGKCPDCKGAGEVGGQFCGGIFQCVTCDGSGKPPNVGTQRPAVGGSDAVTG